MKKRGMVKWQPFASLPEQANFIQEALHNVQRIEKPTLSDEQLDELNQLLLSAYHNQSWIQMTYYYNGYCYEVEGVVVKMDSLHQSITIEHEENQSYFHFFNILAIEIK